MTSIEQQKEKLLEEMHELQPSVNRYYDLKRALQILDELKEL